MNLKLMCLSETALNGSQIDHVIFTFCCNGIHCNVAVVTQNKRDGHLRTLRTSPNSLAVS